MDNQTEHDVEVKPRVNWSEKHLEIFKALITVQPQFEPAKRERYNEFYKHHYADFQSIVEVCKVILPANKMAFTHLCLPSKASNQVNVECMIIHESGEWVSSVLTLHLKDATPQAYGSAITYAKRYTLAAILGIITEDDDGNAASGQQAESAKRGKKAAPEAPQTPTQANKTPKSDLFDGMTAQQKLLRQVQDKLDEAGVDHRKLIEALRAKKQIPDSIGTLEQLNEEILKKCLANWDVFIQKLGKGE